ncbi:MAG: hypothetical protein HRU70_12810 [Phycisphaeraceae bacterium]|nr:MAG: hypothetical protein HRU70_12810 [Phycisphaeraceae bacterium]
MSLTDLMSGMDLTIYPLVAMVLFIGVYALVARRVWLEPKVERDRQAGLPLDDSPATASPILTHDRTYARVRIARDAAQTERRP